jgi:hypothetical protein
MKKRSFFKSSVVKDDFLGQFFGQTLKMNSQDCHLNRHRKRPPLGKKSLYEKFVIPPIGPGKKADPPQTSEKGLNIRERESFLANWLVALKEFIYPLIIIFRRINFSQKLSITFNQRLLAHFGFKVDANGNRIPYRIAF